VLHETQDIGKEDDTMADNDSSSSVAIVAILVLVLVVGLFFFVNLGGRGGAPSGKTVNVDLNVPGHAAAPAGGGQGAGGNP
jgi:hypothetical protein